MAVVLEGVLLKSRAGPARGGVETTAAAVAAAAAAWTSAAVAACVAGIEVSGGGSAGPSEGGWGVAVSLLRKKWWG